LTKNTFLLFTGIFLITIYFSFSFCFFCLADNNNSDIETELFSKSIDDQAWLDTLTQSSATFVAIIAALYTTKVLSIASEKQGISRQIEMLESELEERNKILMRYVGEIEDILYGDAEKIISRFLKKQLKKIDMEFTPSLEELSRIFSEEKKREIGKYELKVLEEYFDVFKEISEKKKEEERKRRETDVKRRAYGIPDLSSMVDMFTDASVLVDSFTPEYIRERELRNYDELCKLREQEADVIKVLERKTIEYKEQRESLAFPKYMTYGYLALFYFSIVGVVFPLLFPLVSGDVSLQAMQFLFFLFITGLIAVFGYIQLELKG